MINNTQTRGCCSTRSEGSAQSQTSNAKQARAFTPAVDIVELTDRFIVTADVPGAAADSVDIRFENGTLTLTAAAPERQSQQAESLVREYAVGDYERTFRLGEDIDPDAIAAELDAGVLSITLRKRPQATPRKIVVARRSSEPPAGV